MHRIENQCWIGYSFKKTEPIKARVNKKQTLLLDLFACANTKISEGI